mmetsp:Transcript_17453/g.70710  ORF Transcript_17453/g.70710 Transcript_17453/m.70710 type:complete len:207 (-) Transcript_17453:1991-2611(-)
MLSIGNGLRAGWRTACLGRRAMSSYKRLIITAAGTDDYEIITKLTSEIQLAGGNIEKSRMSALSGDFTLQILLGVHEGRWESIRNTLRDLGKEKKLFLITRWSEEGDERKMAVYDSDGSCQQWEIRLTGSDNIGLVYSIIQFLGKSGVAINSFDTATLSAPYSGAPYFSMKARITFPISGIDFSEFKDKLGETANKVGLDCETVVL